MFGLFCDLLGCCIPVGKEKLGCPACSSYPRLLGYKTVGPVTKNLLRNKEKLASVLPYRGEQRSSVLPKAHKRALRLWFPLRADPLHYWV